METLLFEWQTKVPKKIANHVKSEDYAYCNATEGIFIVADGVSRSEYTEDHYSIAREAAERATRTMAEVLKSPLSELEFLEAFMRANASIRALNEEKGLWIDHNYLDRDLAACCLACMVLVNTEFQYGYIGDCRIATISSDGSLFITHDQVAEAARDFSTIEAGQNRTITIRKDRRNNHSSTYKTYGVITGEDTALDPLYLRFGKLHHVTGSVTALCSDGIAPFIEHDEEFRKLLLQADRDTIYTYIANTTSSLQSNDEKTLILCRG